MELSLTLKRAEEFPGVAGTFFRRSLQLSQMSAHLRKLQAYLNEF
jgi:hypothetical protein